MNALWCAVALLLSQDNEMQLWKQLKKPAPTTECCDITIFHVIITLSYRMTLTMTNKERINTPLPPCVSLFDLDPVTWLWKRSSDWQTSTRGRIIGQIIMKMPSKPSGATFREQLRKEEEEKRCQCRDMSSFITLKKRMFDFSLLDSS